MSDQPLVRPLFENDLHVRFDGIADVHGEIEALENLLQHLGYPDSGVHPAGRRLVFLGDLTDRGPDSPAVVARVSDLVGRGLAECVLGNHDLNLLLEDRKEGNRWYFGEADEPLGKPPLPARQRPADSSVRQHVREFLASLPLVLERDDVRIVHACWNNTAVEQVRSARHAVTLYRQWQKRIDADLTAGGVCDPVERELAHQNHNPVKVLTSGIERRAAKAYWAGRERHLERAPWWEQYREVPLVVFGHYGRTPWLDRPAEDELFRGQPAYGLLGTGRVLCIDYAIGKRWRERRATAGPLGPFQTRLTAYRFPEGELVFDDGSRRTL